MKPWWISCVAVIAALAFGVLATVAGGMTRPAAGSSITQPAAGMTQQGQQAYGDTYTAIAGTYLGGMNGAAMTSAGLRAYGETYQTMAISYLAAAQGTGVPVQWHDIFTGVGVTLGALLLIAAAFSVSRRQHLHFGRHGFAH